MLKRIAEFLVLLVASWCVMTVTHESGHIVSGWAAGGTLQQAELRPWQLPHSSFQPNPRPLITLWGGPILGVMAPLVIAFGIRRRWMWFVAWFSVLANGTYLAAGWFTGDHLLDTAQLLQHGAPQWSIAVYCLVTVTAGYIGFRRECQRVLGPELPLAAISTEPGTGG